MSFSHWIPVCGISSIKPWVQQTKIFDILAIFCPFIPLTIWKIKILTLKKNTWRYYYFIYVHHKWQSYDVWFLTYRVWQTEFFVILDRFLPFYPPMDQGNQNFQKNRKKHLKIHHLTNMTVVWCMVPQIWSAMDRIFCHFGPFFALLPP